ncbi:MAG TPA: carboxymuconolactone decarboxylase family protein, partial [Steroidobacteraceae bacterium]|nr:carboxymuconolactone decarboxylase family protein [Steroidobacteraceae bacterium]
MSRVSHVSAGSTPEESELVAGIRARRGGKLLNLDRVLLNSPPFARGWNAHLGAVRQDLALEPKLRELAVCAVAVLNGAEYEFEQHEPEWRGAGATEAQVIALRQLAPGVIPAEFDEVEAGVLQLTVEMTRAVKVREATFERVRTLLQDERRVVELVGVIATYNMV